MEQMLRKHDKLKGDSWRDPVFSINNCISRMIDEINEYNKTKNPDELLDAANFIFFAWYKQITGINKW